MSLSLSSVVATQGSTEIFLLLNLPEFAIDQTRPDILAPLFLNHHVQLEGFHDATSQFSVGTTPHQQGERTLAFSLNVPPPIDRNYGATVTFTELPFYVDSGLQIVRGPWEFEIPPDMLQISE